MFKVTRALLLAAALSIVAAACGEESTDDTTDTTAAADAAGEEGDAVEETPATGSGDLQLGATELGEVLVDSSGNTLYLFTPDEGAATSACDAECLQAWPIVPELSSVSEGLDQSLLGTITRDDGAVQATYNGWPLYYYAQDTAPGDATGQGLNDVWYVLDGTGNAIIG